MISRGVAVDYGDRGIRCNAVLPGTLDTPMTAATLAPGADAGGRGRARPARPRRAARGGRVADRVPAVRARELPHRRGDPGRRRRDGTLSSLPVAGQRRDRHAVAERLPGVGPRGLTSPRSPSRARDGGARSPARSPASPSCRARVRPSCAPRARSRHVAAALGPSSAHAGAVRALITRAAPAAPHARIRQAASADARAASGRRAQPSVRPGRSRGQGGGVVRAPATVPHARTSRPRGRPAARSPPRDRGLDRRARGAPPPAAGSARRPPTVHRRARSRPPRRAVARR